MKHWFRRCAGYIVGGLILISILVVKAQAKNPSLSDTSQDRVEHLFPINGVHIGYRDADGLLVAKKGYMDSSGVLVIPPCFKAAGYFSEGLALASLDGKHFGYIDTSGDFAIEAKFRSGRDFSFGLAAVKEQGENGKWGYINRHGRFIIAPRYDHVNPFGKEGLALVGKLNAKGKVLTALIQDSLGYFDYFYIDRQGVRIGDPEFNAGGQVDEDIIMPIPSSGVNDFNAFSAVPLKYGYIGMNGTFAIQPQFDYASGFSKCGLAAVGYLGRGCGFIDREGHFVIPMKFAVALPFQDKTAVVGVKDAGKTRFGLIDEKGNVLVQPTFVRLSKFSEGLARARVENGKVGYIDNTGRLVIEPVFDHCRSFRNGLARVTIDGKPNYISKQGRIVRVRQ